MPAATTLCEDPSSTKPLAAARLFQIATLVTFLAASSAPTPLYRFYQESWGLSAVTLTTIFAVYALALLLTLLTFGSLSDYVGRRPVIFVALVLVGCAMILFIEADSAPMLISARILQGLATGIATAALSAAVLDTHRTRGPLINSVAPLVGLAAGALGSSALAEYAPASKQLVYILLLAIFCVEAAYVWALPETAASRPGALASLRPRVSVPHQARRALLLATPLNIATWALGGFYFSLMPSLVRLASGMNSPLIGGVIVAALALSGSAAILVLRHSPPRITLLLGTCTLILGVVLTLGGVHSQQVPLLFAGTVIAGCGFGASFFGGLRTVMPLAAAGERAGLVSAIYIECYLAFSLLAIGVGLLAHAIGLTRATYIDGIAIIVLAAISLAATVAPRRG
jgi:MFS family permease